MPDSLPERFRLLDLLFALVGTIAFLLDLGSDVWGAVKYYQAGDVAWAILLLAFYAISSVVLQLLSWGWYSVDRQSVAASVPSNQLSDHQQKCSTNHRGSGKSQLNGCSNKDGSSPALELGEADATEEVKPGEDAKSSSDVITAAKDTENNNSSHAATPGEVPGESISLNALSDQNGACPEMSTQAGIAQEDPLFYLKNRFHTYRYLFSTTCLAILHILQLGYPLRCIHSLEVGFKAYKTGNEQYQEYAYFLTHDISMLRLVETFLENTPQLILLLYIVLKRGTIQTFQYFSIATSFVSISWAILDYHQSLRMFLKEKQKLDIIPSAVYFLLNGFFIFARIVCIVLFTSVFDWWIALHFLLIWISFFVWATLQKTTFMQSTTWEPFYRATVAIILYFVWFNIADGKTIYRCVIYYIFIGIDCSILLVSWKFWRLPSIVELYENHIFIAVSLAFILGVVLRCLYYNFFHPNLREQEYDVVDNKDSDYKKLILNNEPTPLKNPRLMKLAVGMY
ncbi:XK-related protein 8 [Bombina bombina]|uniref:XK-related protein 8 n=1 Tax=Bombina bombina TaxID=8345 RepID=UPI00235A7D09|nr:XK-related protein 8 [Bombina bombina]